MRTNSPNALFALIKSGVGLGAIPCFLADLFGLVRILPDAELPSRDLWLVTHQDLQHMARIRVVLEFVAEVLQTQLQRVES